MVDTNSPVSTNEVYLSVRLNAHDLKPVSGINLDDITASLDLTWQEFFNHIHIELDPKVHCISGPVGNYVNVDSKIRDWVSYYPHIVSKYPVSVEDIPPSTESTYPDQSKNFKVPSTLSKPVMKDLDQAGKEKTKETNAPYASPSPKNSLESSELPDMVPVTVRHSLPEFQHVTIQNVLAGLLLTWEEFFSLFNIRLDPDAYIIKGTNGAKFDINEQIESYVGSFKRKQKMYTVTLTHVNEHAESHEKTQNSNTTSVASSNHSQNNQSKVKSDITTSASTSIGDSGQRVPSKRLKLFDDGEIRGRSNNRIEKIAQSVVQSHHNNQFATKRHNPATTKKDLNRKSTGSRSDSLVFAKLTTQFDENEEFYQPYNENSHISGHTGTEEKLCPDNRRLSKDTIDTQGSRKRGRKPKPKLPPVESNSSLRNSRSTRETDSSAASSDSDDDEIPTREDRKRLKQCVLKFLSEKVSPRSFLRIRSEIINLREGDKYFKVTSTVPLTAGMMEQAFCRKITDD